MNLAETYDRIAEDWHRDHSNDDWWVKGTEVLISKMPSGGTLLDVGCGSGVKAKYFLDRGFSVTGIDISKKLLEIARREAPYGHFELLKMENLAMLNQTFDTVFAQASLLHIPKAATGDVVRGMASCTNKGGHVYLAVKEVRPGKPEEGTLQENDYGYEYERFFSYFTMQELEGYLKAAGLTIVWQEATPAGSTVWLQIIGSK